MFNTYQSQSDVSFVELTNVQQIEKKDGLPYMVCCSLHTTTMVKSKAHDFYYKNKLNTVS